MQKNQFAMPTESALYFFGPFPNEDISTNLTPITEMSSLQINHELSNKRLLDYTLGSTMWDWEAKIYEALGPHEHIRTLIGLVHCPEKDQDSPWFLKVEKAPHGYLRDRITQGDAPPMATRMRMVRDLAETVQHIHSRKVIWGAISPQHILLFDNFHIKVSGFGGSCRDDRLFANSYEQDRLSNVVFRCDFRYENPGPYSPTVLEREMFMLGTCICEITEWAIPYGEIDDGKVLMKVIEGEYPHVSEDNPAKGVIEKLWHFKYSSAQEVSDDIRKLVDQMNAEDREMDQEWEKL